MSSNRSNNGSRRSSSRRSRETDVTTVSGRSSAKSDGVNAYSNTFPQILEDNGIRLDGSRALLADVEELLRERDERRSLAPSQCSDGEIERIFEAKAAAATELDIERDVVAAIVGCCRLPHSGDVSWSNMSSMTNGQAVPPRPDLYYGTRVGDIYQGPHGPLDRAFDCPKYSSTTARRSRKRRPRRWSRSREAAGRS